MSHKLMVATACILLFTACNNNNYISKTAVANIEERSSEDTLLLGHCSVSMLQQAPYNKHFNLPDTGYKADAATISELQPLLKGKTIEVFLGSWCGDSQKEVPRLLEVLSKAAFDTASLHLVFVHYKDSVYKQSPQHEELNKNIFRVPAIIVYDERGREMNRIIETPVVSMEKDLLAILRKDKYEPHFKAVAWWIKHAGGRAGLMDSAKLRSYAARLKPLAENLSELNAYGRMLSSAGKLQEALNIFNINAVLFPDKATVYNSLGFYYDKTGEKRLALENFRKGYAIKQSEEIKKRIEGLSEN